MSGSAAPGSFLERVFSPVVLLIFLSTINLMNYVDRGQMAAVLPKVQDDFGLTDTQAGLLASSFILGYMIAAPIFAHLSFHVLPTRLMAVGLALWCGAAFLTSWSPDFALLAVARALVGVGEAGYCGLAPTTIDNIAPKHLRTVWLSIFFAGIPCGYAIGYVSGGLFASQLSWRLAFVAEALFVAPFAIACLFIPKSRSAQPGAASADGAAPKHSVMTSFKILVLNGTYMFNCLGYAALTGCLGSFAFWLPSFLVDYFSMDITEANLYLGVIALSTGIGGTGFGGVMLDKIGGSVGIAGAGRALLLCWIFCLVGFPLAMGALLSGQFHAFFALMFCAQFFLFASTSPIGAAVLSSVPNSLRSHAMALSIAIIHLLGDFPSPVILGVIADAWSLYYAMLMFTFFLILASALFLVAWILARKRAAREKDSETKSLLPAQPADGNMLRSQEVML